MDHVVGVGMMADEAIYCEECGLLLTPNDKRCPRCYHCPTC